MNPTARDAEVRRRSDQLARLHRGRRPAAGQGFTSNLGTTLLVLAASPLGLPVSTTHISNGALLGLGLVRGETHTDTIGRILLTWVVALLLARVLGGRLLVPVG